MTNILEDLKRISIPFKAEALKKNESYYKMKDVYVKVISGVYKGTIGKICEYASFYTRSQDSFDDLEDTLWIRIQDPKYGSTTRYFKYKQLEVLEDYAGSMEYNYNPKPSNIRTDYETTDILGQPAKIGDLIVYAQKASYGRGIYLKFGNITEIRKSLAITVRTIPTKEDEKSREDKLKDKTTFMKLSDDINDLLLAAKLSS